MKSIMLSDDTHQRLRLFLAVAQLKTFDSAVTALLSQWQNKPEPVSRDLLPDSSEKDSMFA